jgi:hypothetical protein
MEPTNPSFRTARDMGAVILQYRYLTALRLETGSKFRRRYSSCRIFILGRRPSYRRDHPPSEQDPTTVRQGLRSAKVKPNSGHFPYPGEQVREPKRNPAVTAKPTYSDTTGDDGSLFISDAWSSISGFLQHSQPIPYFMTYIEV